MTNAKDLFYKTWTAVHRLLFNVTDGRLAGKAFGMPVLELTTTGRKSGQKRTTMLTAPVQEGDRLVLVASYAGDDRHPAWFLNLRDNPEVGVRLSGRRISMRARVASDEEKAALWPRVVQAYKPYASYQRRSSRDIPLVILEPR